MIVAIVGSRTINDYELFKAATKQSGFEITEIVSGGANGVDKLAERYARENNIPIKILRPDWDKFGKSAGIRRNVDINKAVEAVIALWDGKSRGTAHSIQLATRRKMPLFVMKP